jgi:hypothetical protein
MVQDVARFFLSSLRTPRLCASMSYREGHLLVRPYDEDIRIELEKAQVRLESTSHANHRARQLAEKKVANPRDVMNAEWEMRLAKLDLEHAGQRIARKQVGQAKADSLSIL